MCPFQYPISPISNLSSTAKQAVRVHRRILQDHLTFAVKIDPLNLSTRIKYTEQSIIPLS